VTYVNAITPMFFLFKIISLSFQLGVSYIVSLSMYLILLNLSYSMIKRIKLIETMHVFFFKIIC